MLTADQRAFFAQLPRAARALGTAWYVVLALRAVLPALLGITTGWLVADVGAGRTPWAPLAVIGALFTLVQVLGPLQQAISTELGHRLAEHLNERLLAACLAPDGIAHIEDPELAGDLAVARDFDLGMLGPPLSVSMDFIADGLLMLGTGLASAAVLFGYRWWAAPVLLASWASTHWLLRESGVWKDRNTEPVRRAQQHADYAYRLAVDPPAAKEVRLFGLGAWVLARFRTRRQELHTLQYEATRLRERSVLAALAVVAAGNALVFWTLADDALDGSLNVARAVVFLQAALGASAVAFGGLNWALDGAAAPVGAVARIEAALRNMPSSTGTAERRRRATIRFRDVSFTYPSGTAPVLDGFDLTIPAGTSMAIVGVNGAGKTTARQAAVPPLRPAGRRHRDRRDRPAGLRPRPLAGAGHRRVPGLPPPGVDAGRQRGPGRAGHAGDGAAGPARRRGGGAGRPRHRAGQGLPRRHRPLGRAVAAGGTGPHVGRGGRRRPGRAARRAHRAARRAGRGGDLRAGAGRHPPLHHHPGVAPLPDRAPGGPHLRAGGRPGGGAGLARRAAGAGRPLPHHVRAAGVALRRGGPRHRGGARP
ncbi:MAG: hypothetical protein R2749_00425 [Acidimicrobiales bacterium]